MLATFKNALKRQAGSTAPDEPLHKSAVVVFTDIIGYSAEPGARQIALVERFNEYVKQTLARIDADRETIVIQTGDGAAIVFVEGHNNNADKFLDFIILLLEKLQNDSFKIRIGVADGRGYPYLDINGGENFFGHVINDSARVMSTDVEARIRELKLSLPVTNNPNPHVVINAATETTFRSLTIDGKRGSIESLPLGRVQYKHGQIIDVHLLCFIDLAASYSAVSKIRQQYEGKKYKGRRTVLKLIGGYRVVFAPRVPLGVALRFAAGLGLVVALSLAVIIWTHPITTACSVEIIRPQDGATITDQLHVSGTSSCAFVQILFRDMGGGGWVYKDEQMPNQQRKWGSTDYDVSTLKNQFQGSRLEIRVSGSNMSIGGNAPPDETIKKMAQRAPSVTVTLGR